MSQPAADDIRLARHMLAQDLAGMMMGGERDPYTFAFTPQPHRDPEVSRCLFRILRLHGCSRRLDEETGAGVIVMPDDKDEFLARYFHYPAEDGSHLPMYDLIRYSLVETAGYVKPTGQNMLEMAVGDCLITGKSREASQAWVDKAAEMDPRRRFAWNSGFGPAHQIVRLTDRADCMPVRPHQPVLAEGEDEWAALEAALPADFVAEMRAAAAAAKEPTT